MPGCAHDATLGEGDKLDGQPIAILLPQGQQYHEAVQPAAQVDVDVAADGGGTVAQRQIGQPGSPLRNEPAGSSA